jgi:hypothetical protein
MIDFFSKLNPFVFIVSFAIGIFMCYVTFPTPRIIIKHPTPENAGKIVYIDENENCFKYIAEEVQCPDDPNQVMKHPLSIK